MLLTFLTAVWFVLVLVAGYCLGSPRWRHDWRPFAIISILSVGITALAPCT